MDVVLRAVDSWSTTLVWLIYAGFATNRWYNFWYIGPSTAKSLHTK